MEEINEIEFAKVIEEPFVLVDFNALWCGPCQMLKPVLLELEKEFPQIHFVSMDVDECNDLCKKLFISSVPTLCFYTKGKCIKKIQGYYPKETLSPVLEKLMKISEK